jgi:hypothetical protein
MMTDHWSPDQYNRFRGLVHRFGHEPRQAAMSRTFERERAGRAGTSM